MKKNALAMVAHPELMTRSGEGLLISRPVLRRFAQKSQLDPLSGGQVGDGSRNFEQLVESSSAETLLNDSSSIEQAKLMTSHLPLPSIHATRKLLQTALCVHHISIVKSFSLFDLGEIVPQSPLDLNF